MKRMLAAILVAGLAAVGWTALARGADHPTSLSTALVSHPAVPAVIRLDINGATLADLRTTNLEDLGPLPYNEGSDHLAISITWIEHLTRDAWHVETSVPLAALTRFSNAEVADLDIALGFGGDVRITTQTEAYWRLIEAQDPVTEADRVPVLISDICAQALPGDDPRAVALEAGFEDWAVAGMEQRRETYLTLDGGTEPVSRCNGASQ